MATPTRSRIPIMLSGGRWEGEADCGTRATNSLCSYQDSVVILARPAWLAGQVLPYEPEGRGSIPGEGACPGCGLGPWLGCIQEAAN